MKSRMILTNCYTNQSNQFLCLLSTSIESEGGCQPGRHFWVHQLRLCVLFLLQLLPLLPLAVRQLWGQRQRHSPPRWWRIRPGHRQRDPRRPGPFRCNVLNAVGRSTKVQNKNTKEKKVTSNDGQKLCFSGKKRNTWAINCPRTKP